MIVLQKAGTIVRQDKPAFDFKGFMFLKKLKIYLFAVISVYSIFMEAQKNEKTKCQAADYNKFNNFRFSSVSFNGGIFYF
ncbi:MAG: hypothetical protein BWY64_03446 [bacterium ADurb.Bin363]|nr:MAG: hypothetical protein BWY64_03446 [bacterium ADurb.Bin363]